MNWKAYKHLLQTYGREPKIWFALFAEVIRSFINRVLTVVILASMAASITSGNFDQARHYVLLYLVAGLFAILISSIGELLGHYGENLVYGKVQLEYYKKLTNKDMSFYRDNHTGYLTVMMRQYSDSSILLVRMLRGDAVKMFVSLTIPAIVLLISSWKIGAIAIFLVTAQLFYMIWASKKTERYRSLSHEIYRKISGEVADDVTNIVAYKAAGREKAAMERMTKLRVEEMDAFWQRRKISTFLEAPRSIVTTIFIAISFLLVLKTTVTGDAVRLLVLTVTYMFQINRNISDLPELVERHDDLISKIIPTLNVLENTDENIADPKLPAKFVSSTAAISINNMSFRYGDNATGYIFKNMDIDIKGGEHVGIVGLSGAGKSTLANLLMRFDDIESGAIAIDGVDIRDIPQSLLRRNIAYVPQEPVLFHRTIKENIAYHNDKASMKDIEAAAKAAHAHSFISELPKGYNTVVGERGVKLSGGQKQRVVIARAVLKNAPVVLFDEATSALDSESESIIQAALPDIIGKHTAIIIAHRLSTVAGLDRIIVMHNGQIEEEGTHEQLLKNKGRYYSLWQKQTRST